MVLVWVPIIIEPRQILPPPPYRNAVKGERCIDFPSVNRFLKAYTLLFSLETEEQAYQQTHSFTAAAQTKKPHKSPLYINVLLIGAFFMWRGVYLLSLCRFSQFIGQDDDTATP